MVSPLPESKVRMRSRRSLGQGFVWSSTRSENRRLRPSLCSVRKGRKDGNKCKSLPSSKEKSMTHSKSATSKQYEVDLWLTEVVFLTAELNCLLA